MNGEGKICAAKKSGYLIMVVSSNQACDERKITPYFSLHFYNIYKKERKKEREELMGVLLNPQAIIKCGFEFRVVVGKWGRERGF